ncbi:MAG TPA: calcium-binding protein [Allosphingosinicella sp.]|nr:calcium-binding protein [Allosphingosinicella sp.]
MATITGTDDDDDLQGGAEQDQIDGRGGDDVIHGGDETDRLKSGTGADSLWGDAGVDNLYFGPDFGIGDFANGGADFDGLVLQGNYVLTFGDNAIAEVESLQLLTGGYPSWGDTANNFYDYDITMADGNVAAGQQLRIDGWMLRAGEDLTFDGSAETDGSFLVWAGRGVDDLTGGDGVDVFLFENDRWGPNDRVDGGPGRDAVVINAERGLLRVEFGSDSLTGIESISLNPQNGLFRSPQASYEIVLSNGNASQAGGTLIVNGSSVGTGRSVIIDGRGVQDGNLILFGGAGHDVIRGGGGADLIFGALGQDSLFGAGGADTYRYDSVSDSLMSRPDLISGFVSGLDKIDLSRIDANVLVGGNQAFSWIGSGAFAGTGAASAGQLRTYESEGYRWIEGDTDGNGDPEFAIRFQLGTAPLAQGDFIL